MWDLQRLRYKLYEAVKPENFILFVKECEFRKKISHLNSYGNVKKLMKIFNHIKDTVEFNLFSKEELENFQITI